MYHCHCSVQKERRVFEVKTGSGGAVRQTGREGGRGRERGREGERERGREGERERGREGERQRNDTS